MRYFKKRHPPANFTSEKQQKGATFENLHCKSQVRTALGREQGWLCCYCMRRISDNWNTVKIEHRKSQVDYPKLQLDWKNILAACKGGEGNPPQEQHCDTRKNHRSITLNPTAPVIEGQVRYLANGAIRGETATHDAELNDVLGLNQEFLRRNRREKLFGFIFAMQRRNSRSWSTDKLQKLIDDVNTPVSDQLQEYAGVIVWWVRRQLAKRPSGRVR